MKFWLSCLAATALPAESCHPPWSALIRIRRIQGNSKYKRVEHQRDFWGCCLGYTGAWRRGLEGHLYPTALKNGSLSPMPTPTYIHRRIFPVTEWEQDHLPTLPSNILQANFPLLSRWNIVPGVHILTPKRSLFTCSLLIVSSPHSFPSLTFLLALVTSSTCSCIFRIWDCSLFAVFPGALDSTVYWVRGK